MNVRVVKVLVLGDTIFSVGDVIEVETINGHEVSGIIHHLADIEVTLNNI